MKKFLILLVATLLLATGANAAFEKVNTYENNFSDVSENNWFYENVKTAYELGFMNGKSEGKFDTQIKFEGLELNTNDYNKVTFPTINKSSIVQEILYNSKG